MKFDEFITKNLGFGCHQKVVFFFVVLPTLFCAFHSLSWTFTAPGLIHRCRTYEERNLDRNQIQFSNNDQNLECTDRNSTGICTAFESCKLGNDSGCSYGYAYQDYSRYTAVERWDLVCDRHILKPVVQSAYYLGQLLGSLVFGFLSDRFGRKKILILAMFFQLVSGFGMAFSPFWWLFALFRVGAGFAHPGIFMTAVILGMELIPSHKRSNASVFAGVLFSCGQVILGLVAYFVADYVLLQIFITLPSFIFILYTMLVPESARWLVSQRKFSEADKNLRKAAKKNGRTLPEKWWEQIELEEEDPKKKKKKKNFLDLFKTPKVRCRTFVMFFCWPIVSMAYYGMSMKPDLLGTNPYFNFIIGGVSEIPASILMFLTVNRIGRRPLLCGGLITAGLTLFTNLFVTKETPNVIPTIQFLLSKSCMTLVYSTLYAFTPELFPTEIRNMAVGASSMIARFGASAASFMVMFLVEIYGASSITIPFGTLLIAAAILVILTLPETNGVHLPETVVELERERKHKDKAISSAEQEQMIPLKENSEKTNETIETNTNSTEKPKEKP